MMSRSDVVVSSDILEENLLMVTKSEYWLDKAKGLKEIISKVKVEKDKQEQRIRNLLNFLNQSETSYLKVQQFLFLRKPKLTS